MSQQLILLIMGGVFTVFGIAFEFWGRAEEEAYYSSIARRFDVREFIEHMPFRPEPGALRIGGRIAIALGILLFIASGVLWGLNIEVT